MLTRGAGSPRRVCFYFERFLYIGRSTSRVNSSSTSGLTRKTPALRRQSPPTVSHTQLTIRFPTGAWPFRRVVSSRPRTTPRAPHIYPDISGDGFQYHSSQLTFSNEWYCPQTCSPEDVGSTPGLSHSHRRVLTRRVSYFGSGHTHSVSVPAEVAFVRIRYDVSSPLRYLVPNSPFDIPQVLGTPNASSILGVDASPLPRYQRRWRLYVSAMTSVPPFGIPSPTHPIPQTLCRPDASASIKLTRVNPRCAPPRYQRRSNASPPTVYHTQLTLRYPAGAGSPGCRFYLGEVFYSGHSTIGGGACLSPLRRQSPPTVSHPILNRPFDIPQIIGRPDAASISGTTASISGAVPAEVERVFRRYDTNRTDALSRTELKVALAEYLTPPPSVFHRC